MKIRAIVLGTVTLALRFASFASADTSGPPSPPREAVEACADSKEGDDCTVTCHGHEMKGKCERFSDQGLACRPSSPPPPPPPPEAVEACASSRHGDACTVSFHGHEMSGTCETPPGESALACRPDAPPPRD